MSAAYKKLEDACNEYLKVSKTIDATLLTLELNMTELASVTNEFEHLRSLEANQLAMEQQLEPSKRYTVAGITKLRWSLDGDGDPSFDKLDVEVAERYRRKLLQHFHPDKATGDLDKFNLTKTAVAMCNIELLAFLTLGIGHPIDDEDLERYYGTAFQKLAKIKAGFSYKVTSLVMSGNKDKATTLVQAEIDKKAQLIQVAMLTRFKKEPQNAEA